MGRKTRSLLGVTVAGAAAMALLAGAAPAALAEQPEQPAADSITVGADFKPEADNRYEQAHDTFQQALDEAQTKLSDSENRVDDATVRDRLQEAIDTANETESDLTSARAVIGDGTSRGWDVLESQADTLASLTDDVEQAVQARDRRIAEEEAARAAAAAAAAQAQAAAAAARQSSGYSQSYGYSGGYSSYSAPAQSYGYTTSGSCALQSGAWRGGCQGAVDGGGLVQLTTDYGVNIYAGHANTGWSWINNLTAGQTVTLNGQQYQVTGESIEDVQNAPASGTWMQTCNGNGNHLVGIRPM